MKKYIMIVALFIGLINSDLAIAKSSNYSNSNTPTVDSCCTKCKDDKCQKLCKSHSNLSANKKQTADGKKLKIEKECLKICAEKKCCSEDGSCHTMSDRKGCCKKK